MRRFNRVIVDSMENHSWEHEFKAISPKIKITYRHLVSLGCDYYPYGYKGKIGIERKSPADFLSCLSRFEHWEATQLSKLGRIKKRLIIVEGGALHKSRYSSIPIKRVMYLVSYLFAKGFPVLFAGNRASAAYSALAFFENSIEEFCV